MATRQRRERRDTIRVLHVDDHSDFAEMVTTFLERENDRFETEAVASASDGLARLADSSFDCVISDYDMPDADGIEFLKTVREKYPELPFILFTGKGSETVASEAISAGVTDYLQKSSGTEQYKLLAHRITNAVEQSQSKQRVQEEQQRFRTLFDRLSQPTVEVRYKNSEPIVTQVNSAFEDVFGYESNNIVGDSLDAHIVPDDRIDEAESMNQYVQAGGRLESREVIRETADGLRQFLLENAVCDNGLGGFFIYTDISDRVEREETLERNRDLLRHTEQLATVGGWEADVETGEIFWTRGTYAIHDLDPTGEFEPSVETAIEFYHPDDQTTVEQAVEKCRTQGEAYEVDVRLITAEDEEKWVCITGEAVYDGDDIVKIQGAICDITQQRKRRQELEQIETLFQNTQDHLFLINVDESFTIERLNPAWEATPGISVEESRGRTIQDVLGGKEAQKVEEKYQKCVEQRKELEYEERIRFGDEYIQWETRLAPVIVDDEVEYIAGSSRDITERHERRQELSKLKQQYQTLAENFPNGAVYLIDDNFEYVRARGEALKQADLSPADIEGHTPHEVFPDELADETCKHFEQAFNGNTTVVEQEYRNKRYRIRVTPVDGNGNTTKTNTETETEIARVMAVAQDITQYVEDRRELHRQNKQLDEFASVVSHDLRNPLTVAKGNLELLREECNSDDQREQVDKIDSALTRMDELIESILTLARANEQIGSVESVNLAELSQNCWQNVETTDATIHLDITATQTVTVKADVNRLAQLLENLMRNAIEHARNQDDDDDVDKNENVTITIGELTDGFYIADDGDGISEGDRDDVFEAGYTTSKHGTGFGLSIVKQVVEAHGWEISITESADGGARFEVTNVEMSRSESTQLESNRMNSE
jgi:PAS domain S-box-containing protein